MTRQIPSTDVDFVEKLFLGIDVGGTNVKLGLVDAEGTVHRRGTTPTPELGTPQRIFDFAMQFAMQQLEDLARSERDLAGVGLAVPGVLDTRAFELREVVNLPGWHGQPLLELLCDASSLPSAVVNDANSAAYAEHTSRMLGDRSLALITLGTGIGCGLVVNGSPYGGDHGCAGELGHIAIRFDDDALPCTCGSRGHLESYAAAGGLINRLRSAIKAEGPSHFSAELLSDQVTPLNIAAEAEKGSQVCQELIDETAQYVGQAIGMLGQVIDPEVVLLGGAMTFGGNATNTGRQFLERVRATVKATTLVQVGTNMQVDFATHGNDAGVLGAAMIAKQVSQP